MKAERVFLFPPAVAVVCKYITKGWKGVQEAYGDEENPEDVQKVFVYLEAVEKAKHCTDEQELIHLIEEQRLEEEQILTNHLRSKEVRRNSSICDIYHIFSIDAIIYCCGNQISLKYCSITKGRKHFLILVLM